jgi:ATP-binding cassette subfamily B protein
VEREAFARAWRFLNYRPLAKWTALIAAVATGILYLALLLTLGLFVDLLVNRGRIPRYRDLSAVQRDAFLRQWTDHLTDEERQRRLESLGLDAATAGEFARPDAPPDLTPAGQELLWRAQVYQALLDRAGPTAAEFVLPEYPELPPRAREGFFRAWKALLPRERRERLDRLGEAWDAALADGDAAKLTPEQQALLWRAHQLTLLDANHPEALGAFQRDRADLAALAAPPAETAAPELDDRGILSLIVRSQLAPVDRLSVPVLGGIAGMWPWTWRTGDATHPNYYYFLLWLLIVGIVLALLRSLALFVMNYMAAAATIEASTRLRRAVYHHTYRLGTLAVRALGPSEAVGVFTRQLEAVHDGLFTRLTVVFREPVKFALLLAFALALNVWLALAFLLFALLVWLIGGQVAAYYRRQERAAARRTGEQLSLLQESLMLMRLVKGYLMELFNQRRVERQLSQYAEAQMGRYRGEAIYRPLLTFLGTLAATVLLAVAGMIVLSGRLGVARGIILATALVSLYWPLVTWLENRRFLRRARGAAVILFRFLDRPSEVGQVVGAEFLAPLSDRLELDNISLREPATGRTLLNQLNLTVRAGQRIALVGPEDLEKHALIYLILRLLDPDSGEIRIDQHNLRWVTFDSLRAQIAFVLQHNFVFNDTVANNIGCGEASYDLPKIIEAAKIAHAHQFIQKLPKGYETPIGPMGHPLNVGEQFRIALARAILRDPALMIIEEPSTVLDDDTKSLLDDTFARVLPGRTVIFLPHRISTIRSCDRVYLLHNGRIEAAGEHRELLTQSELYRHLQYLEFNVFSDQLTSKGA